MSKHPSSGDHAAPAPHDACGGGRHLSIEGAIRLLAGSFVLLSVVLSQLVSPWFLLLALFVGANLVQSVFTGICPAVSVLRRLGVGDAEIRS